MSSDVTAETVRIWSGLAVRGAFEGGIVADYEARSGHRIAVDWLPTTLIMEKVKAGAETDILVAIRESMDQLIADGKVDPATRVEIAHSRLGLAVAAGAPHPRIDTPDDFRAALLAARSVCYSRAGASGIHFETVIERLGIAAEVRARATVIPAGFTAEKLVTGEADLAVQQVSELLVVKGIELVGKFPEALQKVSSFSAGVMPGSPHRAAAQAFLATLNDPKFHAAYRDSGVDPAV
ncbi:molybdate ABC transporter substrate-binding protein [Roseomonas sp. USHLN139]|uniref:molybdate ABC transporter substrate-binding protein n=1 Tax=Roseomonas sp. USHLN139 TaxID=3081298 RepID=UPI003B02BD80